MLQSKFNVFSLTPNIQVMMLFLHFLQMTRRSTSTSIILRIKPIYRIILNSYHVVKFKAYLKLRHERWVGKRMARGKGGEKNIWNTVLQKS